jgi:Na+/glutamate symporter
MHCDSLINDVGIGSAGAHSLALPRHPTAIWNSNTLKNLLKKTRLQSQIKSHYLPITGNVSLGIFVVARHLELSDFISAF